ncbi:MAG: EAL domain-containing protein [Bacilli bacterium]|nr:EAL domain-containing protein [Bacilli bacterium]MBN2877670.1 EAL domain-containing protein [Bacilli bacterium]
MAKKKKQNVIKQHSLTKRIVSLTVFLDALFLILILSVGVFLYYLNINQDQIRSAEFQNQVVSERFTEIVNDIQSDVSRLADDESVIAYLAYVTAGNPAIISEETDPNYDLYQSYLTQAENVMVYQEDDLYNLVYVASSANCSSGSDGCGIAYSGELSTSDWNLTERPWYTQLASNDSIFTTPYTDELTGNVVISYVEKVYQGSTFVGYVGIDVNLTDLTTLLTEKYSDILADGNQIILFSGISSSPRILYYSGENASDYVLVDYLNYGNIDIENDYGTNGMQYVFENYQTNTVLTSTVFNNSYAIVYSDVEGIDYTLISLQVANVFLSMEFMFAIILIIAMIMIALVALIMHRSVKRSLSPINDILATIDEIKDGNFDVNVELREFNELNKIGEAINMMSSEINRQIKKTYDNLAYDILTGLKNRASASAEVDETIFKSETRVAVCLIQVDNLKNINVTKGQIIGDNLIKAIADELKIVFKNNETLFSNGGNEFVYIKENINSLEEVEFTINRLLTHFKQPLVVKNIKTEVKLHVGVAVYPSDGTSLDELIKKCDTALFKASEEGYKKIIFYNEKIARSVSYQAEISEQLSQAINKDQIYLKYQPLITNTNEIYGFEALARWTSPSLGEIGPQIFIANAEESYLIIPIGTWILRQACLAQVEMRNKYGKDFIISVNVSPVQILQKDFVDIVKRIVKETDVNPEFLTLEITESLFIEASVLLEDTIEELHKIGIKLSLDDFGTGYASLTYLRQIAFDNLKIDKTFVDGIFANPKDHRIVATIVNLVHNLDMKVIAEGVETKKQYEYLKEISTDVFQGYIFSKPLTLEDAYKFMDRFNKLPKTRRADVFASMNDE